MNEDHASEKNFTRFLGTINDKGLPLNIKYLLYVKNSNPDLREVGEQWSQQLVTPYMV